MVWTGHREPQFKACETPEPLNQRGRSEAIVGLQDVLRQVLVVVHADEVQGALDLEAVLTLTP